MSQNGTIYETMSQNPPTRKFMPGIQTLRGTLTQDRLVSKNTTQNRFNDFVYTRNPSIMRNTNPRSLGFKKHYQNSYIDKERYLRSLVPRVAHVKVVIHDPKSLQTSRSFCRCISDPGECETEFSLGPIMGIDGARPGNYEYEISNGLNAGQHIGFQANLNL